MKWALCMLLCASAARAEIPVILWEGAAPQYKAAVAGIKRSLPHAREESVSGPELPTRLADASVVVAVGQQAYTAARRAAPNKPLVYCMVLETAELSQAMATGVPLESDPAAVLALVKELSPRAKKVGFIFNRATSAALERDAGAAAAKLGLELVTASVSAPDQVRAVGTALSARVDALWLPPDPRLFNREVFSFLLEVTSDRKVPLYGFLDSFTEAGALASVSPDYDDIGARAGQLAADIHGRPEAKRAALPPRAYSPGKITINLRTAQSLGLAIPASAQGKARQLFR